MMSNQVALLDDAKVFVEAQQEAFELALSTDKLTFAQESHYVMQSLQKNQYLMSIAQKDTAQFQAAILNIAAIGISLNPLKKHAYLVPRDGCVCLDVSYMGMIHVATESGGIDFLEAHAVYESDKFELHGVGDKPTHNRNPFCKNRGEIVGFYSVVKLKNGDYLVEVMSADEVNYVRDKYSQSYKSHINSNGRKKSPWVDHYEGMGRKTVIRRHSKTWPSALRTERVEALISNDEQDYYIPDSNEEIDITPAPQEKLQELMILLEQCGKDLDKAIGYASQHFNRDVGNAENLQLHEIEFLIDVMRGQS